MSTTTTSPVRLNPRIWEPKLKAILELEKTKEETAAAATAADNAYRAARGELMIELGDATAAVCGKMVVSIKIGKDSEKSFTLNTGRKLAWSLVKSLVVGNETIPGEAVVSLYGGRSGPVKLSIT